MKKNKISIFASMLILMFMMVLAAGCGGQGTTKSAQQTPKKTPVVSNPNLILATTTSTQDSGLLDVLIPLFEKETGYKVKTVAVGTGAALALGEKGDADVLLVHAPASEQALVTDKTAINYQLVMHNDFILVGPASDPAQVKSAKNINDAFISIANKQSLFISRGDDSGTDKMEKALWKEAAITTNAAWYQESGSGMGQTLTIASEKSGYTLTDRATYLANKDKLQLDIVREGDASLLNIYHVMQVNPAKFPKVNADGAKAFVKFMLDSNTQKVIGDFGKDKFKQSLFVPDAGKTMEEVTK